MLRRKPFSPGSENLRVPLMLVAVLVAACGGNVPIETSPPDALISTLPLRIGVIYDPEFATFSYTEKVPEGPEFTVDLGQANVRLFDSALGSAFRDVLVVQSIPATDEVDAVLKPALDEYAFLTPRQSGSDFYAVSIRYQLELYAPDGRLLGSWPINAYGKTRSHIMSPKASLAEATTEAMRDAALLLSIDMIERPAVLALLPEGETK